MPEHTIWNFVDEKTGKVIDKKGLLTFLNNDDWEYFDLTRAVKISPEVRKIVRDYTKEKYERNLKYAPNKWYTRIDTKHFDKLRSQGKDPYDTWYDDTTKDENKLKVNTFLESLLLLYRSLFGDY